MNQYQRPETKNGPDPRVDAEPCHCGHTTFKQLSAAGLKPESHRRYCMMGRCRPRGGV